jgi:hypothetical protein
MLSRGSIALLLVALVLPIGCTGSDPDVDLTLAEQDFLVEDVIDLKTIIFQTAENAYLGEPVDFDDIIEEATAGNGYSVTYDLPFQARIGLGTGNGRVTLRIFEDGIPVEDPLAFTFGDSIADVIRIEYDTRYLGETFNGRETDIDFLVTATATRSGPGESFDVDYFIDGDCFLGATFCRYVVAFRSPGIPRDGVEPDYGDGTGLIDDPDVYAAMDLDIGFVDSLRFNAVGVLPGGGVFAELFYYDEVM